MAVNDDFTPLTLFPEGNAIEYSVRESPRAKTVRLHMTPRQGLVVVVPSGYSRERIPRIIEEKRAWIERTRIWAHQERQLLEALPAPRIPESIELRAVGETWRVISRKTGSERAVVREHGGWLLAVSGPVDDTSAALSALGRWVGRRARHHFEPWLKVLSEETGLGYSTIMIGNQRSRWGSCSTKGKISLNRKLLFLPERVVRYVLVHELCHMAHMNHSKRFWLRLGRHEPEWKQLRRELGDSWRLVPSWMEER